MIVPFYFYINNKINHFKSDCMIHLYPKHCTILQLDLNFCEFKCVNLRLAHNRILIRYNILIKMLTQYLQSDVITLAL